MTLHYITADHSDASNNKPDVMRKQMTKVYHELLDRNKDIVYIGEDVIHGGYYLVTDGLHSKFPLRVRDFPPDETSLVGAAVGVAQSGLLPILEIPYAKYLDCGADVFYEAVLMNWLSNGQQPNGMLIRLQGFDKGVFGGNFHTHNMLTIPPGLDVVCYSNGADYVRGIRYAIRQAKAGRMVMSVDSTDLLNRRHLNDELKDERLLASYPTDADDEIDFDYIRVYPPTSTGASPPAAPAQQVYKAVIVTYGNGVATSLTLQAQLKGLDKLSRPVSVQVIDCPYLSQAPGELVNYLQNQQQVEGKIDCIIFADVCKQGPGMPLAATAVDLHNRGLLSHCHQWKAIGASPTYNPLGSHLTFLSVDDISRAILSSLLSSSSETPSK